jgi:hypothetical protein
VEDLQDGILMDEQMELVLELLDKVTTVELEVPTIICQGEEVELEQLHQRQMET